MRPTLNQIRSAGDFATTVHWNFQFIQFPRVLTPGLTSEEFNFRCESTEMPKKTSQSNEVMIRGHRVKQPGIAIPDGLFTASMIDHVDGKISRFIRRWREICYETNTGRQERKADVEAIVRLARLDRQDNEIFEYVLKGVFLENYDTGGQLQGASAEFIRPVLMLSYDDFDDKSLV